MAGDPPYGANPFGNESEQLDRFLKLPPPEPRPVNPLGQGFKPGYRIDGSNTQNFSLFYLHPESLILGRPWEGVPSIFIPKDRGLGIGVTNAEKPVYYMTQAQHDALFDATRPFAAEILQAQANGDVDALKIALSSMRESVEAAIREQIRPTGPINEQFYKSMDEVFKSIRDPASPTSSCPAQATAQWYSNGDCRTQPLSAYAVSEILNSLGIPSRPGGTNQEYVSHGPSTAAHMHHENAAHTMGFIEFEVGVSSGDTERVQVIIDPQYHGKVTTPGAWADGLPPIEQTDTTWRWTLYDHNNNPTDTIDMQPKKAGDAPRYGTVVNANDIKGTYSDLDKIAPRLNAEVKWLDFLNSRPSSDNEMTPPAIEQAAPRPGWGGSMPGLASLFFQETPKSSAAFAAAGLATQAFGELGVSKENAGWYGLGSGVGLNLADSAWSYLNPSAGLSGLQSAGFSLATGFGGLGGGLLGAGIGDVVSTKLGFQRDGAAHSGITQAGGIAGSSVGAAAATYGFGVTFGGMTSAAAGSAAMTAGVGAAAAGTTAAVGYAVGYAISDTFIAPKIEAFYEGANNINGFNNWAQTGFTDQGVQCTCQTRSYRAGYFQDTEVEYGSRTMGVPNADHCTRQNNQRFESVRSDGSTYRTDYSNCSFFSGEIKCDAPAPSMDPQSAAYVAWMRKCYAPAPSPF